MDHINSYATKVIDNNDDNNEKSFTIFKEVGRSWNSSFQTMCGIVRINNVRNGHISYDFRDYNLNYRLDGTTFTNSGLPSGLQVKTYRNNNLIKTEDVLLNGNFNHIMGNAVIYTFSYDYIVDIEIKFMFGFGNRRYEIGRTPEKCCCAGSKCSGNDPIYNTSSLYDYIDLKVTYNISGIGSDLFQRVVADFNEQITTPGVHSFKKEYDLGEIDFRLVDLGINENKAIDISFFDNNWDPNDEDKSYGIENYSDGPCSRHRAIGVLLREDIQHFRDHTHGELPESLFENDIVTKENIEESNVFKRVSNNDQQICNLNNYNVMTFSEKNKKCNVDFIIYLIKENNKIKLIVEYKIELPNVNGKGNDKLLFKSKADIGLNFKLRQN